MQNSFWAKVIHESIVDDVQRNVRASNIGQAINVSISENAICPQLERKSLPMVNLFEASRKNCRHLKYCSTSGNCSGISPILLVAMLYFEKASKACFVKVVEVQA